MNDMSGSLVNLPTYLNIEHALLGSRRQFDVECRWFGINMGFSDKYQILMENLQIYKGYGAKT